MHAAQSSLLKHQNGCALLLLLLWIGGAAAAYPEVTSANFTFNGFSGDAGRMLTLDGRAALSSGVLDLTNTNAHDLTTKFTTGHAFFSSPFQFKPSLGHGGGLLDKANVSSFSCTFVFDISQYYDILSAQGIAFVISETKNLSTAKSSQYLGLFDENSVGKTNHHLLAIYLGSIQIQSGELGGMYDNNHVGIYINSLLSNISSSAGRYLYYSESSLALEYLKLAQGPIQVWVDYDGEAQRLDVALAPLGTHKPVRPLLSSALLNLSNVLLDSMYVGFSSSTASVLTSHNILGWSFAVGRGAQAPALDLSVLPTAYQRRDSISFRMTIIFGAAIFGSCVFAIAIFVLWPRIKFAEVMEDWELQYGPRRYRYQELYMAAKSFKDKELLGVGGFGRVYKGVLQTRDGIQEVAIKRVSHNSRQGIREFVAEINCLGQLRHRNLVPLLGYCRRKGELLLVYEYMPNGSLDKYLHADGTSTTISTPPLGWSMRFNIIKGVALGLLYLHEDWDKVVIHRDIKASNVLLDADMNGRLSDFGLARLHNHGGDAFTTRVAGTMGYLAPELARTGRATTATDVFAFGVFLLEVVCGCRPILPVLLDSEEPVLLVDRVASKWKAGSALETVDSRLAGQFVEDQVELVLKLGLRCSHPVPTARPSMRQAVQFLHGSVPMPELPADFLDAATLEVMSNQGSPESVAMGLQSCALLGSEVWRSLIQEGR